MKQLIIFILLIAIGVSVEAQETPRFNPDRINPEEDLVVRKVPEDTMIYIRTGQTVGRFAGPQDTLMNSFGTLRYAENFIYGLEYNSFYAKEIHVRSSNVQGIMGYRVIWNKRFLPYALFQFGHGKFKDESDVPTLGSGNGLAVTLDAGADVIKIWKIKASFGIRHTMMNFNSKQVPDAGYTDLYFMTGFVF